MAVRARHPGLADATATDDRRVAAAIAGLAMMADPADLEPGRAGVLRAADRKPENLLACVRFRRPPFVVLLKDHPIRPGETENERSTRHRHRRARRPGPVESGQFDQRRRLYYRGPVGPQGQGDALNDVHFEVDTTRERLTMDFAGQDKRTVFEPRRVLIQRRDGTLTDAREDPEQSFGGHQPQTPWDDIHLAYFTGEALWTYLNMPFLVYLARVRHRRDRPDPGRRRNVAAAGSDLPRSRQNPHPPADLVLRPGRAATPP